MDPAFKEKFETLLNDVKHIKTTVDSTDTRLGDVIEEVNKLKRENEALKTRVEILEDRNYNLEKSVYELEQYGMRNDIIISGIPNNDKEDLQEVVTKLASLIGVEIREYDICAMHRLGNKDLSPIIVRLANRQKKERMLKLARKEAITSSELGYSRNEKIYLSEHLSKYSQFLLDNAKSVLRKDGLVKFIWPSEGKILVRATEKSKILRITSMEDIYDLETNLRGNTPSTNPNTGEPTDQVQDPVTPRDASIPQNSVNAHVTNKGAEKKKLKNTSKNANTNTKFSTSYSRQTTLDGFSRYPTRNQTKMPATGPGGELKQ